MSLGLSRPISPNRLIYQLMNPIKTDRIVNQSPVFYGWIVLFAGTVGYIMTSPGQTYVISVVLEPLLADLEMSRSLVSILYGAATVASGFALPYIGRRIDQYGSRRMVVVLTLLSIFSCLFMASVRNVGVVGSAILLTAAFVFLRLFTHGSMTIVSQNVINQWWIQRRGTVMGINGILWALLGFGAFPIAIRWLTDGYGWRWTYIVQALMLLLIMLPIGTLFFRDRPEAYGLNPDGKQTNKEKADGDTASAEMLEVNWTRADALRTSAFWIASFGIAVNGMMITGLFFHMESIFADNGLASGLAALVFAPIAITSAIVNLGGGILADRVPANYLLGGALLLLSVGLVMSLYLSGTTMAMLYGMMLGVSIGLIVLVQNIIWANYFGRENLGSITGVATTILMVGNGLGPVPLGVARDLFGSYNVALFLLASLPFCLGLGSLLVGKPQKSN